MKRRLASIANFIIPAVFFVLLVVLWQISVDCGWVERFMLPSPTDVVRAMDEMRPDIARHLLVTLKEALMGLGISLVLAVVLALLMDNIKMVRRALYPLLIVSQTIPLISLAPLFALWFGFGLLPKLLAVVLVCFFPITVNLLQGLEAADRDMQNLLKSMGAGPVQVFRLVKFPSALSSFFSGLRIAVTYSIMGAVIAEWLSGNEGLGYWLISARRSFAVEQVFAIIVIIVTVSLVLFGCLSLLQWLCMPWNRTQSKEGGIKRV